MHLNGVVRSATGDDGILIHHSDREAQCIQYVSIRYSEPLGAARIEPSVGRRGDSYDNALDVTFNGCTRLN